MTFLEALDALREETSALPMDRRASHAEAITVIAPYAGQAAHVELLRDVRASTDRSLVHLDRIDQATTLQAQTDAARVRTRSSATAWLLSREGVAVVALVGTVLAQIFGLHLPAIGAAP